MRFTDRYGAWQTMQAEVDPLSIRSVTGWLALRAANFDTKPSRSAYAAATRLDAGVERTWTLLAMRREETTGK
ncbi:hypothetical protein BH11MYX3_BH11MYX3_31100 [soil metagenome]